MFTFEGWIGSPFLKEIHTSVEIPQKMVVMQWNLLLSERQTPLAFSVQSAWRESGNSQLLFFIAFLTHGKSPIVDENCTHPLGLMDEVFLFSVRVDPEFNSFLHHPYLILLSLRCFLVFNILFYCFRGGATPTWSIQNSCLSRESAFSF